MQVKELKEGGGAGGAEGAKEVGVAEGAEESSWWR